MDLDPKNDEFEDFDPASLPEGTAGFLHAYLAVEKLVEEGYDFIDISLILRENFGEPMTEKVILDAKERGIL